MSGVTGGSTYGAYSGGDGKYQSYDNKNYNNNRNDNNNGGSYGNNKLNTAYGDYTYNQSTLAKYKDK